MKSTDLPLLSKIMHTVMSDIIVLLWLMDFTKLQLFSGARGGAVGCGTAL
jgi:hypothetical protein